MKTLADLKRDAKTGMYEGRMIVRCGSTTDIPEKLRGWRRIQSSNSKAVFFLRDDGKLSELRVEKSSLVEYDGDYLTTYRAGYRDLNDKEKKVMDGWKSYSGTPDFKERAKVDVYTDGSSTYWSKVAYFKKSGMEYLMGLEKQGGLKYDLRTGKVQDDSIKGEVDMKYEIRKAKVVYEDKYIKVERTYKEYDFIATIENKCDYQVCVVVNGEEMYIESNDWAGILADDSGQEILSNLEQGKVEVLEG